MRRTFITTLAFAHLRRRRTQNLLSVFGVAIGVCVLVTALSLTNGFIAGLVRATIKAVPHISLLAWSPPAQQDVALEAKLAKHTEVQAASPFIVTKGLLTKRARAGRSAGLDFATVFGVDPAREAKTLNLSASEAKQLSELPAQGIILGAELATNLGAQKGDTIILTTASFGKGLEATKRGTFQLWGTFRTGNYQIDSAFGFVSLPSLQRQLETAGIGGYHIRIEDPERASELASRLSAGTAFYGTSWQDQYQTLISQLQAQKTVISIVLLLMVVVALFGTANTLVLSVFEKTQEIAILRAMGASRRAVQGIFLLEGITLGTTGLVLGNLLALVLSAYFTFRPITLPGDLYFTTTLPAQMRAGDFLWVSAASFITTLLAALLPARRAANIEPAKIIR